MKKRGVSDIITTVLIILIVLAAIVIVWNVVKKTVSEKSGEIGTEKFSVGLSTQEVNLTADPILIPVSRSAGQGNITSIKIIFKDADGNSKEIEKNDCIPNELETKICGIPRGENEGELSSSFDPKSYEVYPVLLVNGKEVIGLKAGGSGGGGGSTPGGEPEGYYCSGDDIENHCNGFDGNYYNKSLCLLESGCNAAEILCDGADANRDGNVDSLDSVFVSNNLGKTGCGNPDWCNGADANRDGDVNELDYVHVSNNLGRTGCNLEENIEIDCYTTSKCEDKNEEASCYAEPGCLWILR